MSQLGRGNKADQRKRYIARMSYILNACVWLYRLGDLQDSHLKDEPMLHYYILEKVYGSQSATLHNPALVPYLGKRFSKRHMENRISIRNSGVRVLEALSKEGKICDISEHLASNTEYFSDNYHLIS